jgi:hypothetical protein
MNSKVREFGRRMVVITDPHIMSDESNPVFSKGIELEKTQVD